MSKQTGEDQLVRLADYLTTEQAAERIGCTPSRVSQLRRDDQFKGVLVLGPRYVLIPRKEVEKFAKEPQKTGRPRKNSA